MSAFVTGGTGFIGKRLARRLLQRSKEQVYILTFNATPESMASLMEFWGRDYARVTAIAGDISKPDLGIAPKDVRRLKGKIDHFFHLAAVYDLAADPSQVMKANVQGVANALAFAKTVCARRFHHMSSIAAAGLFDGVFREDMFEEARGLEHPYFASKHRGEALVRAETKVPWRIYRPGIVVGDSKTGKIDKIDGPYYFFKLIPKLRDILPHWAPMIGLEGGRINVVHLAHLDGLDGRTFHLTDPSPLRVGEVLNVLARAAHAPAFTVRINAGLFGLAPPALNGA
jgi:thioester reductase-like protein